MQELYQRDFASCLLDGAYGLMFLSDFSGLIQLKTLLIPQMLPEALLVLKYITLLLWTIADNHCQLLMNYLRVCGCHTDTNSYQKHLIPGYFGVLCYQFITSDADVKIRSSVIPCLGTTVSSDCASYSSEQM